MLQRILLWSCAALFCFPVYVLANAAGLPNVIVLVLTFLGAIFGSYVGALVQARLQRRRAGFTDETPRP